MYFAKNKGEENRPIHHLPLAGVGYLSNPTGGNGSPIGTTKIRSSRWSTLNITSTSATLLQSLHQNYSTACLRARSGPTTQLYRPAEALNGSSLGVSSCDSFGTAQKPNWQLPLKTKQAAKSPQQGASSTCARLGCVHSIGLAPPINLHGCKGGGWHHTQHAPMVQNIDVGLPSSWQRSSIGFDEATATLFLRATNGTTHSHESLLSLSPCDTLCCGGRASAPNRLKAA